MLNFLFYFFSIVLIFSSLAVVISHNSIVSVLFLVLSFFISAILFMLLECEFLALMLVIIYVGAVAVLFLFVLMMLDTKLKNLNKGIFLYFPFGIFINFIFFIEISNSVSDSFLETSSYITTNSILSIKYCSWYEKIDSLTDIETLGNILYTHFVLQFVVVGFILFLALIGVVYLTANPIHKSYKNQTVFYQLSRNSTTF